MSHGVENRGSLISVPLALRVLFESQIFSRKSLRNFPRFSYCASNFGSSQTWLFAIFTRKRSFALFCALLRSFVCICGLAFALICALLRAFVCFCERPCLERPRLGTADNLWVRQNPAKFPPKFPPKNKKSPTSRRKNTFWCESHRL